MTKEIERFIEYLKNQGYQSVNTLVSYQRDLKHLQTYLQKCEVNEFSDATEEMLENYLKELLAKGTATSSISRCTATIHHFFGYLVTENKISENVALNLKAPHVELKKPEILTEAEIEKLLDAPKGNNPKAIRDRAILRVLYETGFRVTELISLQMDDIDLKRKQIVCKGKVRNIKISRQTVKALNEYLNNARVVFEKGKGSQEVFLNYSGNKLSRQGLWKLLKIYGELAEIEKEITPHVLRHSFAVHSLRDGMDIQVLSKVLGHSDLSTTKIYRELV
jgi:integrase/recombinase XerD